MIKRFLLNLIVSGLGIYLLLRTAYDGIYTYKNIVDASFVVGMIFTAFGLITSSNAGKVFHGVGFAFKQMFSRKNYTHLAFYDYKRKKEEKNGSVTGVYTLSVGLLIVIISTIISYTQFNV